MYQPLGLSGRDAAEAVPPVRIIFLLQHILNTNQFFSAFCTVFAGIFPGGGSTVTFGKSDSHISTSVSIKKLWLLMHSCKKSLHYGSKVISSVKQGIPPSPKIIKFK